MKVSTVVYGVLYSLRGAQTDLKRDKTDGWMERQMELITMNNFWPEGDKPNIGQI